MPKQIEAMLIVKLGFAPSQYKAPTLQKLTTPQQHYTSQRSAITTMFALTYLKPHVLCNRDLLLERYAIASPSCSAAAHLDMNAEGWLQLRLPTHHACGRMSADQNSAQTACMDCQCQHEAVLGSWCSAAVRPI